jgi:hypothetical protein
MIVNVQNRFLKPRITAELAADAVIDLDLGNLAAVKPGDKVAALGFYLNPGVCEKTQVIEVALSNTLLPPGMRARKPRAVAKPDASHAAAAKTKANADATAGKKAPEAGASGKAPAKGPDELEVPPDMPPDQNAKPAQPKTKPPANPQEPPIKDDNVLGPLVDPAPEEKKPEAKKPVEKPQKAPPGKDDEKDVFDN